MKSLIRNPFFFILGAISVLFFLFTVRKERLFFPRMGENSVSEKSLQSVLKDAEERLSKDPADSKSLVDRGVVYFHMGPEHYAEALNALNQAWRSGAFDKRIFYYSGILYEDLSLFEEALKQYERFLKHEPEDREIRLRRARLLFRMEKWAESIQAYQGLIKENEKDVTSLINMGLAHEKKAEPILKQKRKPTAQEQTLVQTELRSAVEYLERAIKVQPDLPEEVCLTLAAIYSKMADWPKAIALCESELKKNPEQKEILQILSLSYEMSGQREKALETYTKLLEKEPHSDVIKKKIRILKSQLKIK